MLKRTTRYFLAGLVTAQVVGCASYKQGAFPNTDPKPEAKEESVEIRVGSEVQIETTDGEFLSGEVIRVSDSELVVGRVGNYGYEKRTLNRDKIARVQVRKDAAVSTFAVSTLGVLVITCVVLGVLMVATGGIQFGD